MKRAGTAIVLLFSILVTNSITSGQDDSPIPDCAYLGQTPPGSIPEVFAPDVVNKEESTDLEGMFGSDMNTFYFVREGEDDAGELKLENLKGMRFPAGWRSLSIEITNDGSLLSLKL